MSLSSTDSYGATAADVDNDAIPSDAHWADVVDMDATDATDATVLLSYNDGTEL